MTENEASSQAPVQPPIDPINRGGVGSAEQKTRCAKDLIEIEWQTVDRLLRLAEKTQSEKTKGFYYQTLAGHIRTLAMLLKLLDEPEQTQDLAKLLSQITKEAKTMAKRLRQE